MEKIKLLYCKKPVSGNKSVTEILGDEPEMLLGGKEVEFGIMVLGVSGAKARVVDTEGSKGKETSSANQVLESESFWEDLQTFLVQKIHDETAARRVRSLFSNAWARR